MGPCSVRAVWFCAAEDIRSYFETGPRAEWFGLPTTVICKDLESYEWFLQHEIDLSEISPDIELRQGFDPAGRMTQLLAAIAGSRADFIHFRFAAFQVDQLSCEKLVRLLERKFDCVSFEVAVEGSAGIHYPATMLARRYSAVARNDIVFAEPESFFFSAGLVESFRNALVCSDFDAADFRLLADRISAAAPQRLHAPLLLGLVVGARRGTAPAPFANLLAFELFGGHDVVEAGMGVGMGVDAGYRLRTPDGSIGSCLAALHAARGLQPALGDFVRHELFRSFLDLWRKMENRLRGDLRTELRALCEATDAIALQVVNHMDVPIEEAVDLLRSRLAEESVLSDDPILSRILWTFAHPGESLPAADVELAPFQTPGQQRAAVTETRRLREQVDHWRAECARFALQLSEERTRNRRLRLANEQLRRQVASQI